MMKRIFYCLLLSIFIQTGWSQKVGSNATQWYNWTEDGVRHYVYEIGKNNPKNKTFVVLHGGWGAEHSYLIDPLEPLSDEYRFILYDQRGSLRSPAPEETIRLERLVEDLEDLRKSLEIEKLNLAAHSMGNHLAYAYLDKYPVHVNNLILIGPVLPTAYSGTPNMKFIRKVWKDADSLSLAQESEAFYSKANKRAKAELLEENLLPNYKKDIPADELNPYGIGSDKSRTLAWRIFFYFC